MSKRLYSLIAFLCFALFANAQLVINEIMYNPPETGEDSLEFIEILNAGNAPVSLNGMKFNAGVTFTFPEMTIGAGNVVVVAKDTAAMRLIFNISSLQFSGALSNSGEGIVLADAQDNVLDEVIYDDAAPWPLEADEGGASLVLCDPTTNNADGANWIAARNVTGKIINGKEVKGSPGIANAISCTAIPSVFIDAMNFSFNPKDITIDVGTTVRWTNKGGTHNINGNQTVFPANPASFGNGSASSAAWTYDFTFTKAGLYQYQCDVHAGMNGTVTVGIVKQYPSYSIPVVSTVDQQGVADSLGVSCELTGTVHGINLRPGGLQFVLIDGQNNGIGVFNGTSDLGYTVREGDELSIKGSIDQYYGLTQIVADELSIKSTGNATVTPKSVSILEESDESSLVIISALLNYVNVAEWKGDGTSFNVNVTDGVSTFLLRIDNDCDLSSMPAPSAPFSLTGLIGQFDAESPYDEEYQILPRYAADIDPFSSTSEADGLTATIYPNPATEAALINGLTGIKEVILTSMAGEQVWRSVNTDIIKLDLLAQGIYFARIVHSKGVSVASIVVQRP
ncbi:MAG: lamin tail domain-containing protein [Saprospiraceae bacterium]|nr:lamin tail domain-containing protein [Saprospiraceae bacterium]